MSLSNASTLRIASHVWPVWLPKALTRSEVKTINSTISNLKPPIPPLLFSASFQSMLPQPLLSTSQNWAFKQAPRRPLNSQQQIRRFLNSPQSPPEIHDSHILTPGSSWTPPTDISGRPVTILGAGVLGRRLAVMWASTGSNVTLYDNSPDAIKSATTYIADALSSYCAEQGTHPGKVHFTTGFHDAVLSSWMVIEAVPEDLELKISLLGRVDRATRKDCIIATNSSSFASRELVYEVKNRERVLNTLYYIPPANKCVELLGCGYTSKAIFPFLDEKMREVGLRPRVVTTESSGLIFPRIWSALRRETLKVLEEGAAKPEDVDELFRDFFGATKGPCEKMDEVGLDTIAKAERIFLEGGRGGKDSQLLRWLEREFVEKGRLGEKTGSGLLVKPGNTGKTTTEPAYEKVWKEHTSDISGL